MISSPAAAPDADGVTILIPVFNDWDAVGLLLAQLDCELGRAGRTAGVLLVDDGSTLPVPPDLILRATALHRVSVLTLRRNLGHQRALAIGLSYIEAHMPCRAVVVMDGDGEDAPADVVALLDRFEAEGGNQVVFAERTRRSESTVFRVCYAVYRSVHWVMTGIKVRVGNFSVLPFARLASLVVVSDLWNHYPASVFRSRLPFTAQRTARGRRLVGQSKMNFLSLVIHGLSAIAVFRDRVGVRLLVACAAALGLTLAALGGGLCLHLAGRWTVPSGLAVGGSLLAVLLTQLLMLTLVFTFIVLGGRESASFLPVRDYAFFVSRLNEIYVAEGPLRLSA
jgi:hypothetical protein